MKGSRRPTARWWSASGALAAANLLATSAAAARLPLVAVSRVPLPGPPVRFDYTSLDEAANRLYIAHMDAGELVVLDVRTNRIVRRVQLPFCRNDHGLYVDSSRRLAFVACDENATLLTLGLRTFRVTGHTGVGASPDVLAFDAGLRRLYVSAESGVVSVFAVGAHGLRKLGEAFLAPEAHSVAVDPRDHLVYFPLQSGTGGRAQLLIMKPAR